MRRVLRQEKSGRLGNERPDRLGAAYSTAETSTSHCARSRRGDDATVYRVFAVVQAVLAGTPCDDHHSSCDGGRLLRSPPATPPRGGTPPPPPGEGTPPPPRPSPPPRRCRGPRFATRPTTSCGRSSPISSTALSWSAIKCRTARRRRTTGLAALPQRR